MRITLLALAVAVTAAGCTSGDQPDTRFDTRVTHPAHGANGPRVLFDEAHHNHHHLRGGYSAFARLIESDGCRVTRGTHAFTREALAPYRVLVVATAMGSNERNDDPAFTDAECDAVRAWVADGGGLLVVTDHYPFGHAMERLVQRFGVRVNKGEVDDAAHADTSFDETHIVYTDTDGGLAGSHPIIRGRAEEERVHRVLTFTGEAVSADPPAVTVLRSSPTAVLVAAHPVVERRGGDVLVHITYGDSTSAEGWGQAVALEYGKGRVVVTGEAAMLTAQLRRFDRRPIGMNVPGYDNRQLALNIMRWLTRDL